MSASPTAEPLPAVDPRDFDKWSVFKAIGYEPDEWQRKFHENHARHRILACGVRVGKTYLLAAEAAAAVLCPSKKSVEAGEWIGSRVWVVAPTYDLSDRLFKPTAAYIRRFFPWIVTGYSERERILRTIGGGYLQGKSADNSDSLVGEELDAAIIDEAPRVGEFEKEQVRQRLITREGWFAAIGSPVPCKWFQRDFALGQGTGYRYEFDGDADEGARFAGRRIKLVPGSGDADPEYFSMNVPSQSNARLSHEILIDWERTMPERIFRQDVLAEFMGTDGQVFSGFERLANATRRTEGEVGHRYIVGWDVARAKDYSVVSILDYGTREQVFMDRFQGPWNVQLDRVVRILRRFNRPDVVVDATGKGDPIAEELKRRNHEASHFAVNPRQGYPDDHLGPFAGRVEGCQINNNAIKRDIVEGLVVGFDQGLVRILDEPIQNQELRLYEYKQSDATGVIRYGAPSGFHDDTVMALALAWWRAARPMGTGTVLMG
jgi:hypothetical protein